MSAKGMRRRLAGAGTLRDRVFPANTDLIGVGWSAMYSSGVVVDEVVPSLTSVRVEAYAEEDGAPNAWALQVRAICASAVTNVEIVDDGSSATTRSRRSPTPSRARSARRSLVSATRSARQPAEGEVHITKADPSSDRVDVTAYEDDTGTADSWAVTAFAVCATEPFGLEFVPTPSPAYRSDTTTCPAGKVVIGGGADLGVAAPRDLYVSTLKIGTRQSAEFALASGIEDTGGTNANWTVAAEAICAYP